MRFEYIITMIAALATTSVADRMEIREECSVGCDRRSALFYTDFGTYNINGSNGCRGTSVPGMIEFCVDIPRNRAHFKFSHQSFKRCMILQAKVAITCPEGVLHCSRLEYGEVPCTWREAGGPEEPVDNVSVAGPSIAAPAPTTLATAIATKA